MKIYIAISVTIITCMVIAFTFTILWSENQDFYHNFIYSHTTSWL